MSRKDYIAIAAALAAAHTQVHKGIGRSYGHEALDTAAQLIADALADDNPRFDRERFLLAVKGG